jgi:hypothetical protein
MLCRIINDVEGPEAEEEEKRGVGAGRMPAEILRSAMLFSNFFTFPHNGIKLNAAPVWDVMTSLYATA